MDDAERFGLTWPGKAAAAQLASAPAQYVLRPKPQALGSGDLLVVGDNLEALRCFEALRGRVKLIYIDPPYNTGRSFTFRDSFASTGIRTPGRRHAGWLSMIYPRLLLAEPLLRDDGAIFVSIDDREVHHLRALMDEVFGEGSFVASIVWQKVFAPKNSARHLSVDHEYVLLYAKDPERWRPRPLPRRAEADARYKNPDGDPRGPWASDNLCARNPYGEGVYGFTTPGGRVIDGPPPGTYWRVSERKLRELDADGRIWWGPRGTNRPRLKRFLSEVRSGRVPQTLWTHDEVGHTQEAKKELLQRLRFPPGAIFDTPKPTRLVRRILEIGTEPGAGDVVLDFFAGSGTTGDAVWQQNHTDGGDRRWILVEQAVAVDLPDYGSLAELTAARLRAAAVALEAAGAPALGFEVAHLVQPAQHARDRRSSRHRAVLDTETETEPCV